MRNRVQELRVVRAAELRANPKNWRSHPEAQREALAHMLDDIGMTAALVARELPDGTLELLDGHLRREVADDADVPVVVVDLDDAEADRALATLDPIGAMATAETDRLRELLEPMVEMPPVDYGALYGAFNGAGEPETTGTENDTPDPPVEPVSQAGDIWTLGDHRLACGDSTDADAVAALLDGATPELLVTDPPFGVRFDPNWRTEAAEAGRLQQSTDRVDYMDASRDDTVDWADAWRHAPCEIAYIWQGQRGLVDNGLALRELGWDVRNIIVWAKPTAVISRGQYANQVEYAWYAVRNGRTSRWIGPPSVSNLWAVPWEQGTAHAAQKPVELMERPLEYHDGDVYEPFAGSGSTIIACERRGRRCLAMEIEPRFVDVAVHRWQLYTGREAFRVVCS